MNYSRNSCTIHLFIKTNKFQASISVENLSNASTKIIFIFYLSSPLEHSFTNDKKEKRIHSCENTTCMLQQSEVQWHVDKHIITLQNIIVPYKCRQVLRILRYSKEAQKTWHPESYLSYLLVLWSFTIVPRTLRPSSMPKRAQALNFSNMISLHCSIWNELFQAIYDRVCMILLLWNWKKACQHNPLWG